MPTLRQGGHKDLEKYYQLMQMDFDSEELIGKLYLHKAMMKGEAELLILQDEETKIDLSYAFVITGNVYGYVLLKYFAVLPWYRGKGVGIETMRALAKKYSGSQGIVAEITDFPDQDPDHQKKLKKYFSRFGYEPLSNDYKISGTDAHIYVKAVKAQQDISPVIHRVIRDFYSRILTPSAMRSMIDISPLQVSDKG